jgi:hypothetical protein
MFSEFAKYYDNCHYGIIYAVLWVLNMSASEKEKYK